MKETICIAKGRKAKSKIDYHYNCKLFCESTFEVIPTNPSVSRLVTLAGKVLNSDFT